MSGVKRILSYLMLVCLFVPGAAMADTRATTDVPTRPAVPKIRLAGFFENLPACEVFELTAHGLGRYDLVGIESLTVEQVEANARAWLEQRNFGGTMGWDEFWSRVDANEAVKQRYPDEKEQFKRLITEVPIVLLPTNRTLSATYLKLAEYLKGQDAAAVRAGDVLEAAQEELRSRRMRGEVAECYYVINRDKSAHDAHLTGLASADQRRLDEQFSLFAQLVANGQLAKILSLPERALLKSGQLTLVEIAELRALRRATKMFEQMTALKNDVGGWVGNYIVKYFDGAKSPWKWKDQAICVNEATTFQGFLQTLQRRGLLKHFQVSENMAMRTGAWSDRVYWHVGDLLINRRTGERFVLDSWIESGGRAAHITLLEDWLQRKDYNDVVSTSGPIKGYWRSNR